VDTPAFQLTATQWQWLITGVDWQRLEAAPSTHWRV
jgi:transposase